ncbi:hypothetical protein Tco_0978087 [Tanacetum coccineum]|uniref:Uncharacterized protein n=1 Tax=Tanacetum coccineum TaxID=301880 RepID=A0ABQ5ELZ6_9ASTR
MGEGPLHATERTLLRQQLGCQVRQNVVEVRWELVRSSMDSYMDVVGSRRGSPRVPLLGPWGKRNQVGPCEQLDALSPFKPFERNAAKGKQIMTTPSSDPLKYSLGDDRRSCTVRVWVNEPPSGSEIEHETVSSQAVGGAQGSDRQATLERVRHSSLIESALAPKMIGAKRSAKLWDVKYIGLAEKFRLRVIAPRERLEAVEKWPRAKFEYQAATALKVNQCNFSRKRSNGLQHTGTCSPKPDSGGYGREYLGRETTLSKELGKNSRSEIPCRYVRPARKGVRSGPVSDERLGEIDMSVKMRTTMHLDRKPYEASLFPGLALAFLAQLMVEAEEGAFRGVRAIVRYHLLEELEFLTCVRTVRAKGQSQADLPLEHHISDGSLHSMSALRHLGLLSVPKEPLRGPFPSTERTGKDAPLGYGFRAHVNVGSSAERIMLKDQLVCPPQVECYLFRLPRASVAMPRLATGSLPLRDGAKEVLRFK